ncbi:MAG: hypothetical protein IKU10_05450, partial [Clostridia bacterium]|nr:hypothetical protein [Clostridia bacterium]
TAILRRLCRHHLKANSISSAKRIPQPICAQNKSCVQSQNLAHNQLLYLFALFCADYAAAT